MIELSNLGLKHHLDRPTLRFATSTAANRSETDTFFADDAISWFSIGLSYRLSQASFKKPSLVQRRHWAGHETRDILKDHRTLVTSSSQQPISLSLSLRDPLHQFTESQLVQFSYYPSEETPIHNLIFHFDGSYLHFTVHLELGWFF
ncbi:hypothetical protein K2173_020309 [Erythroxylum novogranatense]|uniref:Uncharacterized protein n=1 Tax=Erythroxylum novogranatense TaxID=1862640 RepID=A0AAV8UBG1_9ROSI|nr:hypothetical protein K2173_020309 [Erythroxylum novogranatense]